MSHISANKIFEYFKTYEILVNLFKPALDERKNEAKFI